MSDNRRNRSNNPYRTVSASERRARRRAREGGPKPSASERASIPELPQDVVTELLMNPTKVVTEEQLRSEYGYVLADIRSMGILTGSLIVLLILLATLLPS